MSAIASSVDVLEARDLARAALAELPLRWRHTVGVATRAAELVGAIDGDRGDVLVAAAWLHDIGYGAPARDTGFHPLDGARYLDRHGWPPRIAALVAYHSGAWFMAAARGLSAELSAYRREESAMSDALTYADQTTGQDGRPLPIDVRIGDMLRRHGPGSLHALVHPVRGPYLLAAARRVERRLRVRRSVPAPRPGVPG
jgi:hypothetical protein